MTYFNLRKRDPETEPEEAEKEQPEEAEDEPEEEKPVKTYGPVVTGILGPGRWIAARIGTGWAWGIHGAAAWAIGFYRGWTAAGILLVWLAAVLAFTPREFLDRLTAAVERRSTPAPEPPAPPAPGGEREAVQRLLLDVLGEAPGVHLNAVLAHLQEHGQWEGKTVTDLRARLAHLGIPHDRSVKVAGVPTWGVRRRDLVAPSPPADTSPSPAPSPAV